MMPMVLAFKVCLLAQPTACRDLPVIHLDHGVGMMGCMMASQQEGAKWRVAHPDHFVARARCIVPSQIAKAT